MKITEIKLAGNKNGKTLPDFFATISRAENDDYISVTLHIHNGDIKHRVLASDETDVFSMAECLQECLDGYPGTNSDKHGYYRLLEHFMD